MAMKTPTQQGGAPATPPANDPKVVSMAPNKMVRARIAAMLKSDEPAVREALNKVNLKPANVVDHILNGSSAANNPLHRGGLVYVSQIPAILEALRETKIDLRLHVEPRDLIDISIH